MRRCNMLAGVLALSLALVGCDPFNEADFIREGIGTELYSPDMEKSAFYQEVYSGLICEQAGISTYTSAEGFRKCDYHTMRTDNWNAFVLAGMNDIDRRCDAYLAWYDNRKRSSKPILKQISDTRSATEAILRISGMGADPITIVGLAFGFVADAFTNVNSRLLFAIESSTVQAVVLGRQNEYRKQISTLNFRNKPAAYQALRNYLRICMPYTIETEINNVLIVRERGGGTFRPLVDPGTTASAIRASQPVFRPRRIRETAPGFEEKTIDVRIAESIQKALCLDADGKKGPKTIEGIRIFQGVSQTPSTGVLNSEEQGALSDFGRKMPCPVDQSGNYIYRNYLEREVFEFSKDEAAQVMQLREKMKAAQSKIAIPETNKLSDLRATISQVKRELGISKSGNDAYLNEEITQDLLDSIKFSK